MSASRSKHAFTTSIKHLRLIWGVRTTIISLKVCHIIIVVVVRVLIETHAVRILLKYLQIIRNKYRYYIAHSRHEL